MTIDTLDRSTNGAVSAAPDALNRRVAPETELSPGSTDDSSIPPAALRVFMMDLWATLPYYVCHLTRALVQRGAHVTIGSITYYLDRDCFTRFGLENRAGAFDVVGNLDLAKPARRVLKLGEGLLNLLAWTRRFRKSPPCILHVQFLPLLRWRIPVDFLFLHHCKHLGIRLVYTVHDALPHDTGERFAPTYRSLYSMMDALICHSEAARVQLHSHFGVPMERIWVIPHGPFFYDCTPQAAAEVRHRLAPNGECLVLCQGLIFPYKGIDFLLRAWALVQASGLNARLVIAGTGCDALLHAIKSQAADTNILASVHLEFRFLPLDEMIAFYQAADIVVYPYKAITTSGALMTGIAQGKAIVATRLPAFSEIITHGANGMLVDYGDTNAFADCLMTLIQHPETRASYSKAIRDLRLGATSWDSIAEKTIACYRSVIQRGQQ